MLSAVFAVRAQACFQTATTIAETLEREIVREI